MATATGLFGPLCEAQRQATATAADLVGRGIDAQRQTAGAGAAAVGAVAAVGAAGASTTRAAADVAAVTTPVADESRERFDRRLDTAEAAGTALFESGTAWSETAASAADAAADDTHNAVDVCAESTLEAHEAGEDAIVALAERFGEAAVVTAVVATVDGIDIVDRPDERFEGVAVEALPDA